MKNKPPLKWAKFGKYIEAFCNGDRYLIRETEDGFRTIGVNFVVLKNTLKQAKAFANKKNRERQPDVREKTE